MTLALALPCMGSASAMPLDKESCKELKAQHDKQLTPEIEDALARGPDWVKEHLDVAKLDMVREYLELEAKIEFQCRTGRYITDYNNYMPMPLRRPEPPKMQAENQVKASVTTSQARAN
ncbi:hypothetical protein V6C03_11855 [Methyloligella sp. 2.7D]|uniref:hypothetical protein n=1 Tax=unclassified Methyloligella TaxID=2625955 RepID=UPI00157DFDB7|nr:hypothetical protein [Methyloligella sp. GL2]QKP77504.1 hypothetical protein HT051_08605 [Methyloligella sp. GL2]